jgi:hypothetical protein
LKSTSAKFYYYEPLLSETNRDYVMKHILQYIVTNDISGESFVIIHL